MVSKDDHNIISGGHDEAERLPRGGGHHEGDETSKPGPGIKHVCATSAKLLTFGNTVYTNLWRRWSVIYVLRRRKWAKGGGGCQT